MPSSAGTKKKTAALIVFGIIMLMVILMLFRLSRLSSALLSTFALLTVFSSSSYAMEVRGCFFSCYGDQRDLHSFPTRRSSDLSGDAAVLAEDRSAVGAARGQRGLEATREDRKSTRLNSSHVSISYAVFCLK